MAVSFRAVGTWAELTADGSVVIPATPQAGDRMYLFARWKDFSITATVANWTELAEFADGSTSAGNGTGSVKVACWYRDWQSGDTDPVIDFSANPDNVSAVIIVMSKEVADSWLAPIAVTAAMTNWTTTSQVVSASSTANVLGGGVVMGLIGIRDDTATMTRPTNGIDDSAAAITWNGNYVEAPTTHHSTTTGFDGAADLGYRLVSEGATATLRMTGTISAAETGAALWVVQGVQVNLAVADSTHAHTSTDVSLTQVHMVAVGNVAHVHTATSPVLTQIHALTASDAAHGHSAESATLTQAHSLIVNASVHDHTAENLVIQVIHHLAIQDTDHLQVADGVSLSQVHQLAIDDVAHAHAASNLNIAPPSYRTSSAAASTFATGGPQVTVSVEAGDLLVLFAFASGNTNDTPTALDTFDPVGEYDLVAVAAVSIGGIDYRLSAFVRTTLIEVGSSSTVIAQTGSNTSRSAHVYAIQGMSRAGLDAIRSVGLQSNQSAATTPAPTLNQAALTSNITLIAVGSADTTTEPSPDWTERHDTSTTTPSLALESASRDSGFTGTTITFDATQDTEFCVIAIELDTSAPSVSHDLVIQAAGHAHAADAVALTQAHGIMIDGGAHAHDADSPLLAQSHTLTSHHGIHSHFSDNLTVSQDHALAVENATHAHSADSLTLTETYQLAVDNAAHGYTSDNTALTQAHSLQADSTAHAHTAENLAISTAEALGIADTAHAHSADNLLLTQVHALTTSNGEHAHVAENTGITSTSDLVVQPANHQHAAESLDLTQVHVLTVSDSSHAHAADSPLPAQSHELVVESATHSHSAQSLTLTQTHQINANNATHSHVADALALTQVHFLTIQSADHVHAVESLALGTSGTLGIQSANHAHSSESVVIAQVHELEIAASGHSHAADNLALAVVHHLEVQPASHAHSSESVTLAQAHALTTQSAAHSHSAENVILVGGGVIFLTVQNAFHLHAAQSPTLTFYRTPPRRTFMLESSRRTTVVPREARTMRVADDAREQVLV